MGSLKIYLFNKLSIESDGRMRTKLETRKAEELLVFLLLHRDQPHSRERLADMLWGEITQEQSKSYLRKALWQLQSLLQSLCAESMLIVDGEWIQINPRFEFWLDIAVFEKAFRNTEGARGRDLAERQSKSIQGAVEIYRGELLEGWYQDWCIYERERLRYLYLAMLDKLMDYCEVHQDYEHGLNFGERILCLDRAHERTHRCVMRLHYLAGDRTAALRHFWKCAAALKEELDVEPADHTHLLYEMIREDRLENSAPSHAADKNNNIASVTEEPLVRLFNHLDAFHKSLSDFQTQIAQDIQILQRTIKSNRY